MGKQSSTTMAHQGMASTLEAPDMRAGYDNPEQGLAAEAAAMNLQSSVDLQAFHHLPPFPPISSRKQFTLNAGTPNPRLPRPHSRANPDAGFVRPRQREVHFPLRPPTGRNKIALTLCNCRPVNPTVFLAQFLLDHDPQKTN